jgi:hypothetical protein
MKARPSIVSITIPDHWYSTEPITGLSDTGLSEAFRRLSEEAFRHPTSGFQRLSEGFQTPNFRLSDTQLPGFQTPNFQAFRGFQTPNFQGFQAFRHPTSRLSGFQTPNFLKAFRGFQTPDFLKAFR